MPASYLDQEEPCPPLKSLVPQTLALLESGALKNLANAIETELDEGSQKVAASLIVGVMEVFPPSRLEELDPLLETELFKKGMTLISTLLGEITNMPPELREPFAENLYTIVYSCPIDSALNLLAEVLKLSQEERKELSESLGKIEEYVNLDGVSSESWFAVLKPLLNVMVNATDNPEALNNLLANIVPEEDLSESLMGITSNTELMEDLEAYLGCLLVHDDAQNDGLLKGFSYILGQRVLSLSDLSPILEAEDPTGETLPFLLELIKGITEDPDTMDNMRALFAWLLEPSRAEKLIPEIEILIKEGALEELLKLATHIGRGNCDELLDTSP